MTSLSEQVLTVFQRFARQTAAHERERVVAGSKTPPATVLEVWSNILGPRDGDITYDCLAVISAAVVRLRTQVEGSETLPPGGRGQAVRILNGFYQCVMPSALGKSAMGLEVYFKPETLDIFSIAVVALRSEDKEPDVPSEDIERLAAELDDLVQEISKSQLPGMLKAVLLRHATFMAWAIRNVDMVGTQAGYEAVARVMISIHDIPDDKTGPSEKGEIKSKLKAVVGKVMATFRAAHDVHEGVDGITGIAESASKLLDIIS